MIIRPGDVKTIEDEGMPMHKNPFVKVCEKLGLGPCAAHFPYSETI
jgi:hypothetical protein